MFSLFLFLPGREQERERERERNVLPFPLSPLFFLDEEAPFKNQPSSFRVFKKKEEGS